MAMDPTARTEAVLIATYPDAMMFCAYCRQRATVNIPASPGRVCFDHALEFWTALLAYAKDRSERASRDALHVTSTVASSKVIAA
jgi:hypothetical protein